MSVAEGARRMRVAGRWLVLTPLGVMTLVAILTVIPDLLHPSGSRTLAAVVVFIPMLIPGAVLWLAGWIVEGFADHSQ